jgi:hypothetical protein
MQVSALSTLFVLIMILALLPVLILRATPAALVPLMSESGSRPDPGRYHLKKTLSHPPRKRIFIAQFGSGMNASLR